MSKRWYQKLFRCAEEPVPQTGASPAAPEDRDAQFGLGLKYANGEGETQDFVQAAEWYRKAAAQSHALAQFNLGVLYANGQGVPRDDATALLWIRKAADQGEAAAQFNLGVRFQRASAEARQIDSAEAKIEAYKWLNLAAAQGFHGSAAASERVTLSMTREDVTDGNQRVAAFVAEQSRLSLVP